MQQSTTVVSIIIPTYNRPQGLVSCMQSVKPLLCHEKLKIIVVLDGCAEESWEIVKLFDSPNLFTIEGDGNLYWGGAIALGMQLAFDEVGSDAVIWLNDDSVFTAEDILNLVKAHQALPEYIIGGNLVAKNLEDTAIYSLKEQVKDGLYSIPYLNGNCTLIPRKVYERIGNIDANKFPHFADAPYIDKACKLEFKCLVAEQSKVGIHYDIVRHLPIFLQMLTFQGNFCQFLGFQLFRITSKWFLPYRWSYTLNKFGLIKTCIAFPVIFLRDFFPAFMLSPLNLLPRNIRKRLVLLMANKVLDLPQIQLNELNKELYIE
jgi:GT2 family glycosyltransferase